MMDTVLNLGLNDDSVKGLAKQTNNERFAYDSYRRFVQMFGKIVLDVPGDLFEEALHDLVEEKGVDGRDRPRARPISRASSRRSRAIVQQGSRRRLPDRPARSSSATRSKRCSSRGTDAGRATTGGWRSIPDDLGTAVNVQTMVFGNKGDDSGTGVAFTRNPSSGENTPYGDFLTNAQGEDVVAGIRITEPLDAMGEPLPRVSRAAARRDEAAREPLPRHVRHRVHDRAGSPVHPPDARRQAHRCGRAAHGGRDGGRRPDRPGARR